MEVKPGYKQTEVGVIPEGWDVVSLGLIGTFSKGRGVRKDEAASGDLPCIRYGEIYTHHNDIIQSFNSWISTYVAFTSKRLKKGDLLFAGSGETKDDIGKCVAFLGDEEAYAGSDIVLLSPSSGNSEFLGYLCNAPVVAKQKARSGQGDAVVHVSASALANISIPFPPFPEQRAIAAALRDMDELLGRLDQLIAKKRDLKQAALQQLLTGQARLPAFNGEWGMVSLDAITARSSGYWGASQFDAVHPKQVKVIRAGDVSSDGKLTGTALRFFTGAELEKARCQRGDVVLTGSGSVGKVWYCDDQDTIAVSNFVKVLRPDRHRVHGRFLSELLRSDFAQSEMNAHIANGVLANLGKSFFTKPWVPLPPLPEQDAIATIALDLDSECSALVARREKTYALKKSMMQELLTGRIRLLPTVADHA